MRIRSGTPLLHASLVAAALVTLGLAGTFLYLKWRQGTATVGFTIFMAPFLLMGGLLAFFGARGLFRLARHGGWQLDLPDEGGRLGTSLRATLLPRRPVTPNGEIQCRLRCVRSVRTQVQGNRGRLSAGSHVTMWEESWAVKTDRVIHPGQGLDLTLPFPADGQSTVTDERTGSGIQWQLNVVVPTRGYDHESMFEIPVRA